jgi:hypothetical protein
MGPFELGFFHLAWADRFIHVDSFMAFFGGWGIVRFELRASRLHFVAFYIPIYDLSHFVYAFTKWTFGCFTAINIHV